MNIPVIIVLSVLILLPLVPFVGSDTLHMFDQFFHLERIWAFLQSVREGVIPPTWSGYLAFGFGSPVLLFNWTLPYYIGSLFVFLGFSYISAFKILILITYVGSFASMYTFLKRVTSHFAAFIGSTMYLWGAYRFNITHLRGAIGEGFALMFWPLLFIRGATLLQTFAWAFLLISHQAMALMILPMWLLYMLYERSISRAIIALGMGLGLSAFSWLPAVLEKTYLGYHYQETIYTQNFVPWQQLLSQPGLMEFGLHFGRMFYAIGWPLLLVGLMGLFIGNRSRFIYLAGAVLGILLLRPQSLFLWDHIPLLSTIGYPQRFLGLVLFCLSTLSGIVVQSFPRRIMGIAGVVFLTITVVLGLPYIWLNPVRDTESDFHRLMDPAPDTTDVWGEFMPLGIPPDFVRSNGRTYGSQPIISMTPPTTKPPDCVQSSTAIRCIVNASVPTHIRFRQFWFPGFQADADGKYIPIQKNPDATISINLDVPTHTVTIAYRRTPIRHFANAVSVASLCVLILLTIKRYTKHTNS